ncbi:hypothetical protein BMR1_02g01890 [Babesia microti strain RI]|uniref:Uncharacterized protein n=1 Tax=Babesia microti (strain RI) TaxID=1133968 RepID=I7IQ65_BABMR|nr:hypothetical protein BMR1_02g01890 [Babesia microti strain RI]CCF73535.1 hypothetical protein BMR1_02g01890 [Babesia microti strain RI]|eukprot:XP_012648144.1 hypothetical protein BMR1_02g01890 [Babesia microti strain RI]
MDGIDWVKSLKPQNEETDMSTIDWTKFLPPKLEIPELPTQDNWRLYKKSKKHEIRLRILRAKSNK